MALAPAGGRGPATPWVVAATLWVTLGVAYGLFFYFPVFVVPLLEEFRGSRGVSAGAFSLSAIVQGLLSPAVGALSDRLGPRRVIVAGAVVLGASCVLASRITALWQPSCRTASGGTRHGQAYQEAAGCR